MFFFQNSSNCLPLRYRDFSKIVHTPTWNEHNSLKFGFIAIFSTDSLERDQITSIYLGFKCIDHSCTKIFSLKFLFWRLANSWVLDCYMIRFHEWGRVETIELFRVKTNLNLSILRFIFLIRLENVQKPIVNKFGVLDFRMIKKFGCMSTYTQLLLLIRMCKNVY